MKMTCEITRIFILPRRQVIVDQCLHDLVPLYRAQLWAALLDIQSDTQAQYDAIDKVITLL